MPWPTIGEIAENGGLEADGKMLFHLELLEDDCFIESKTDHEAFGFEIHDTEVMYRDEPLRLTSRGRQFIEAMDEPEIWSQVKTQWPKATARTR